jgi:hypothetical protein
MRKRELVGQLERDKRSGGREELMEKVDMGGYGEPMVEWRLAIYTSKRRSLCVTLTAATQPPILSPRSPTKHVLSLPSKHKQPQENTKTEAEASRPRPTCLAGAPLIRYGSAGLGPCYPTPPTFLLLKSGSCTWSGSSPLLGTIGKWVVESGAWCSLFRGRAWLQPTRLGNLACLEI